MARLDTIADAAEVGEAGAEAYQQQRRQGGLARQDQLLGNPACRRRQQALAARRPRRAALALRQHLLAQPQGLAVRAGRRAGGQRLAGLERDERGAEQGEQADGLERSGNEHGGLPLLNPPTMRDRRADVIRNSFGGAKV